MVKGRGAGYSRAEHIRVGLVSMLRGNEPEQEKGKRHDKHARCMIRRRKGKG